MIRILSLPLYDRSKEPISLDEIERTVICRYFIGGGRAQGAFMAWSYWISLYIRTHCVARGRRTLTLAAYEVSLKQFSEWIRMTCADRPPNQVSARDVLEYIQHLRDARDNGDSNVNRAVVVVRSFYRAIVAMGYLEPSENPMAGFPTINAVPRKPPVLLAPEQVSRLLAGPKADTIIGLRDAALLALLYGTGIRASECATLRSGKVDLIRMTITVNGNGGHERTIPLTTPSSRCYSPPMHRREAPR
jgi:site-specific recombinase XerD